MKKQNIMLPGTVPKSNRNIVETEESQYPWIHTYVAVHWTHVRRRSLSWIITGISVTSGEIKVILWPQLSHLVKWCSLARLFHMCVQC